MNNKSQKELDINIKTIQNHIIHGTCFLDDSPKESDIIKLIKLLNENTYFIPIKKQSKHECILLSINNILFITYKPIDNTNTKQIQEETNIVLTLSNEESLKGKMFLTSNHKTIQSFINAPDKFLSMHTNNLVSLINKQHIFQATEI